MKRLKKLSGIQGLLYLVVGALLVFFGFKSPAIVDDFNIYWMMTVSSFVLGILLFLSDKAANVAINVSRIVVGGLFIVSGLIKANDTVGFGYKLEEYFRDVSLGGSWEVFEPYSLQLSILISGAEVLLGLAILLGAWPRLATTLILVMTLFFAWLTDFTADCVTSSSNYKSIVTKLKVGDDAFFNGDLEAGQLNYKRAFVKFDEMSSPFNDTISWSIEARKKLDLSNPDTSAIREAQSLPMPSFYWECVDDCGCFGDALKGSVGRSLTPRESFYKDMFLLFFVMVIFLKQGSIKLNELKDDIALLGGGLLLVALFGGGLFGWWFPTIFTAVAAAVYLIAKKLLNPGKLQVFILAILMTVLSYGFAFYTFTYLPIKDYRPYSVGSSVIENMMTGQQLQGLYPEDSAKYEPTVVYTNWLYKNNQTEADTLVRNTDWSEMKLYADSIFNKRYTIQDYDGDQHILFAGYDQKTFDFSMKQKYSQMDDAAKLDSAIAFEIEMNYDPGYSESFWVMRHVAKDSIVNVPKEEFKDSIYPMADGTWEFVADSLVWITPPTDPEINVANLMLKKKRMLWVVSYDIAKANEDKFKEMKEVMAEAQANGVEVAFISSADPKIIAEVQDRTGFYFPYYICDPIELKIIVRSNPGMVYLESGVVKGKWDYNRIPEYKDLK